MEFEGSNIMEFEGSNNHHIDSNKKLYLYPIGEIGDICGIKVKKNNLENPINIELTASFFKPCYLCAITNKGNHRILKSFPKRENKNCIIKVTLKKEDVYISVLHVIKEPIYGNEQIMTITQFNILKTTKPIEYGTNRKSKAKYIQPFKQIDIDMIYYINLDNRPERKLSIESELVKLKIPKTQTTRIRAEYLPLSPQIGCAFSHMKALRHARQNMYDKILILEDDFIFKCNRNQLDLALDRLYTNFKNWNVVMLATINSKTNSTNIPGINKVVKADTTSGYLVRGNSIIPLFSLFLNCTKPHTGYNTNQFAIDVAWQIIQPQMNWYIFCPNLGTQSDKFESDIEAARLAGI